MVNIKAITLVLENLDSFTFEAKYIGDFAITNIHRWCGRVATNAISAITCADTFLLEIYQEAEAPLQTGWETDAGITNFQRLMKWNDIVSVEIEDAQGNKEDIIMQWEDEDGDAASNKLQTSELSTLGNLYICIDKDKDVGDYFPNDEINDSEYMSVKKQMSDLWSDADD